MKSLPLSALARIALVCFGLLAVAGCDQLGAKKAAAVSQTACKDFSKKLCAEVGEQAPACQSAGVTLDLMPPEACAAALTNMAYVKKKAGEMQKRCVELMDKLCKDIGPDSSTCELVKQQTKTFPPERCAMMMQRYDEVLAELKRMEQRTAPLPPAEAAKLVQGSPPSFGAADAKVTIVEFSDFECPYCSKAAAAVKQVKEKYGDRVHFVFRQFPLSFHQNARGAAEASLAANAQGKFWEFHDKLFENQQALDRPNLEKYAKEVGLNVGAFKKALDDKTFAATVDADLKLGEGVNVDGTPTMFLNGKRVQNPSDFAMISKEIETALR